MSASSDERLHYLTEEACEVGHIVQKIHRFGPDAFDANDPAHTTNHMLLHKEVGDALYVVELMVACGDLQVDLLCRAMQNKAAKMRHFTRHQDLEEFPTPCTVIFANPPQAQRTPTSYIHNMLEDIKEKLDKATDGTTHMHLAPYGKGWGVFLTSDSGDRSIFEAATVEDVVRFAYEEICRKKVAE